MAFSISKLEHQLREIHTRLCGPIQFYTAFSRQMLASFRSCNLQFQLRISSKILCCFNWKIRFYSFRLQYGYTITEDLFNCKLDLTKTDLLSLFRQPTKQFQYESSNCITTILGNLGAQFLIYTINGRTCVNYPRIRTDNFNMH